MKTRFNDIAFYLLLVVGGLLVFALSIWAAINGTSEAFIVVILLAYPVWVFSRSVLNKIKLSFQGSRR